MAIEGLENVIKADSAKSTKIDCTETTEEFVNKSDWRLSANANGSYSHALLINNSAGKIIANYWLDKVYSKAEGDAHRNGDYHIHDLDSLSGYCFTAETRVRTVEHGTISLGELVERNVREFTVESYDIDGFFAVRKTARNIRKTRSNAELVEVLFEDGTRVRCTPDHKFLKVNVAIAPYTLEPIVGILVGWTPITEVVGEDGKPGYVLGLDGRSRGVTSVTPLDEREDVYCMEVEDTHCFALENGAIAHNCCGHDLMKLLNEGFNGVAGRVGSKPPKHVREALNQMANYIGILQAEWAGAQAFSSFDTYLAPLVFFDRYYSNLNFGELKKAIKNFVYNLNVPSRWGQCVPADYKALRADGKWVYHTDLKVGDRIYVFDRESGSLKTDVLKAVNVFDAPSKMHKYTSQEDPMYSFVVTPNHKVVVREEDGSYSLKESAELLAAGKPVRIPLTAPGVVANFENTRGGALDIDDAKLELYAIMMFRGYVGDKGEYCIAVNRGDGIDAMLSDIEMKMGTHFERRGLENRKSRCALWDGCECEVALPKALGDELLETLKRPQPIAKSYWHLAGHVDFVNSLSMEQATHFFNTIVRLCGHYDSELGGWFFELKSADPLHDAVALLCMKFGSTVKFSMTSMDADGKGGVKYGFMSFPQEYEVCVVEEVEGESVSVDKVWCPTTDTGTFIACPDDTHLHSGAFITGNSPFSNVTIDLKCPKDLEDRNPTRNNNPFFVDILKEYGESLELARKIDENAQNLSRKDEELLERLKGWNRVIEAARARLNDYESDEETICYSLCYKHFDEEMKMVMQAYYEVMNEGDDAGLPFTFPIPTVNITEDFDWDNQRYDILWENTAKYGCSYFQNFVGSQYLRDENGHLTVRNPDAYSPDDVRSMCPLTLDTEVVAKRGDSDEEDYITLGELNPETDMVRGSDNKWYHFTKTEVYTDKKVVKFTVIGDWMDANIEREVKMSVDHLQPACDLKTYGSYVTKTADELQVGDILPCGYYKGQVCTITKKEYLEAEPTQCISLIGSKDNLFLLANCILTHNCRLQLDKKEVKKRGGGLFGSDSQTGSVGVVTINLARLGYLYKGDEKGYLKRLFKLMDYAKSTIEKKRKFIKEMVLRGLYPYTRRYINSAKDGFTTFFSTIGVNGMNESIRNFTNDEHDITDEFGQRFAMKICKAIRERLSVYQEETGNLYNFEATPGEGTTYRFAKEDRKRFGMADKFYVHCPEHGLQEVPAGTEDTAACPVCGEVCQRTRGIIQAGFEDMPYYTNSTQLPANYGEDVFSALDLQDDLQCTYNGGTVFHIYSAENVSGEQVKNLMKRVLHSYRMPYISFTASFSVCPKHGRIPGLHDYCPLCDKELLAKHSEEYDPAIN